MEANSFELKKFSVELRKKPDEENLGKYLVEDSEPKLIKRFSSFEEAKKELQKYEKASCYKFSSHGMAFYNVEGYGIECNVVDEDGEWVDGGDYEFNI